MNSWYATRTRLVYNSWDFRHGIHRTLGGKRIHKVRTLQAPLLTLQLLMFIFDSYDTINTQRVHFKGFPEREGSSTRVLTNNSQYRRGIR